MEELLYQGLKGLIAAGPLAVAMGIAMRWLVGQLKLAQEDVKKLNSDIAGAKTECLKEIIKAKDDHSKDKSDLYERVMAVLEHLGGHK